MLISFKAYFCYGKYFEFPHVALCPGVWCSGLRFPAIRKPKSLKFSKNKSHIKNSLRSDRFDMTFNEKFNSPRFSNGLQSRPEHQMPERTATCGNSKKMSLEKPASYAVY